jgi:hypothetical protein
VKTLVSDFDFLQIARFIHLIQSIEFSGRKELKTFQKN